jgi:hypothetical protein
MSIWVSAWLEFHKDGEWKNIKDISDMFGNYRYMCHLLSGWDRVRITGTDEVLVLARKMDCEIIDNDDSSTTYRLTLKDLLSFWWGEHNVILDRGAYLWLGPIREMINLLHLELEGKPGFDCFEDLKKVSIRINFDW